MTKRNHGAFSLLELMLVLVVTSLAGVFLLSAGQMSGKTECYIKTKSQLHSARDAIERFAVTNDRLPLPARRNVGVNDASNGREVALADIGQLDSIVNADGSVAVFGALPVATLGLLRDEAADCWGNKLTYVVTKELTEADKFLV
jgi:type II secretory pathway pseudopilin PulG